MIIWALWKKEWKSNYKIMALFLALITMYSVVITLMFDPELGESLEMMANAMPELFSAFGMDASGTTLLEFVSNYLYGFILIVIPLIFILFMCSRLITRYVDKGSMAYLLATPNPRGKMIRTQLLFLIVSLLFTVIYVICVVDICGYLLFDEILESKAFLTLNIGLFGLHLFFASIAYFFACSFDDTRFSIGISSGLSIVFVLIQMLSQVGDKMEFLKYLTPLTLFQPKELIALDGNAIVCVGVLYLIACILFLSATIIFKKRDISV